MLEYLLERWFRQRISIKRIEKHFARLGVKKGGAESPINPGNIRVSCVQRQIRPVKSIEQYMDMLNGFVKQAADEKSVLVVFPEYNFFDLLGLIPGFALLDRHLNNKTRGSTAGAQGGGNSLFLALLRGICSPVEEGLRKIVSLLSEGYGVYIYTGSFIIREDAALYNSVELDNSSELYNAGALYSPDGSCLGTQKKLHLTPAEVKLGLKRGSKMEAYCLPFGSAVCPVCMDATYFETFRIARELNSHIAILPIANQEEYSFWRAMRGIWPRVQESYIYGLKGALNGWIAGMHFTGKAGVFAPLSLTPGGDGVLALSPYHEGDYVVSAQISIYSLMEERKNAQYYGDSNPEFEREYMVRIYM